MSCNKVRISIELYTTSTSNLVLIYSRQLTTKHAVCNIFTQRKGQITVLTNDIDNEF